MVPPDEVENVKAHAIELQSLQLSERSVCDLEMLTIGAFSPLASFMGKDDYDHVLNEMRLANGAVFPIPVTLPIETNQEVHLDHDVALRNSNNNLLAIMSVDEGYEWASGRRSRGAFR